MGIKYRYAGVRHLYISRGTCLPIFPPSVLVFLINAMKNRALTVKVKGGTLCRVYCAVPVTSCQNQRGKIEGGNPIRGFPPPPPSPGRCTAPPSRVMGKKSVPPLARGGQRRRLWNPRPFKKAGEIFTFSEIFLGAHPGSWCRHDLAFGAAGKLFCHTNLSGVSR